MKHMTLLSIALLFGFSCTNIVTEHVPEVEIYKARVTYYSPDPKWGTQVACPNTPRAVVGRSIAAHPDFDFGTKVYIPELKGVVGNGLFRVDNRGSAVTSKRAAGGRAYVFDVYVGCRQRVRRMKTAVPDYMTVVVRRSQ